MSSFTLEDTLKKLRRYLPAQAPMKDFVHHNTLHAFQGEDFFDAARKSAHSFGTKTLFSIEQYKAKYAEGFITDVALRQTIQDCLPSGSREWHSKVFEIQDPDTVSPRIGRLRGLWKTDYSIDMDGLVRPKMIRLVNAYLDQGISFEQFPGCDNGLLGAISYLQENSYVKLFHSKRVIKFLRKEKKSISELLTLIVGVESYYEQYLFDQQFSHPGLSGMVCAIERKPDSLFESRSITLFDFIYLELLFELEALEDFVNQNFKPLAIGIDALPVDLFANTEKDDYWLCLEIWQKAFEKSYHDQVLKGIQSNDADLPSQIRCQAFFCIDDREESIRRNIEMSFPQCVTFGSPAHFSIHAAFKPSGAQFATQICPGPITPKYLIKESTRAVEAKRDIHFHRHSHRFFSGFIVSQTIGFWSSLKLLINILKPKETASQYSAKTDHMDFDSELVYECTGEGVEEQMQIGLAVSQMVDAVYDELNNTGLKKDFAPLIYFFGHGGSSTNNPYFAGYNCGACSGRPSSVNARVLALIANRKDVRDGLASKGIQLPSHVHFVGAYHDTTQDTFAYFDEIKIPQQLVLEHEQIKREFDKALDMNAKERARQFQTINIHANPTEVHKRVVARSRALFEPRPEYNHSNNCLYIIGNRRLTRTLFLDQRAFLNSYNSLLDPEGKSLERILNAGTGVCGGINLEYFFSTVDNEKLGAGSKLPQNIFGLYGVANGVKGDLRPGLPWQMIDVHDPIRIMTVVEHDHRVVKRVLDRNESTRKWYENNWMKLFVLDPKTNDLYQLVDGEFQSYSVSVDRIERTSNFEELLESSHKNLPVYKIQTAE